MDYELHGHTISVDGECGIYHVQDISSAYSYMDVEKAIAAMNTQSVDEVIARTVGLRDLAMQQAKMKSAPKPIREFGVVAKITPGPTPIEEKRPFIENTVKLCEDILKVLQGN